jgi:hypothetical protein
MMNEARPFASLSGSLLARKGGAKPAMRPRPLSTESMLDDLGWDDMGDAFDAPTQHVPSSISALTPAPKAPREDVTPVHVQQRSLASHFEPEETVEVEGEEEAPRPVAIKLNVSAKSGRAKAAATEGKKAAFTLRLDADRHLRLRLANALTGKSSQQLVTAALDAFLESLPEVGTLARHVPARASSGN